jgi:hypothetical protein
MSNITQLKPLPAMPPDLPEILRRLADDVESGAITSMIVAYVQDGNYEFLWPSSLIESMTLTTIAQQTAIDRFRR